ncbi:hypothetical protein B0T26DRAFT_256947 [Lasiosphaeria miniovina]|uniref:Zn(2)-C6 fungal-type domain-containing protein n=1 Tax=Lasiosphaeria miniovina TaxID=1954250 RepID=A0AA40AWF1_9PEZI|nr:uncharacterized protein B0T26DRAFT_256947 [Lasiosphaeria miniovina]KAK0723254.1 hypothetical protein B0T26DRAFT_256947 [Lasiosphaeria miniovina]
MVYNGKPSRGCRTCRTRRIKCDEGKPTCQRCAKSRRECGGYRPEFEIVHRDQTRSTVRRVQHRAADLLQFQFPAQHPQNPSSSSSSSSCGNPASVLSVPVDQRATCYFASNLILLPQVDTAEGVWEFLVPLVESEPPDSALSCAFRACAYALLGNRMVASTVSLANMSLKEHTLALAKTHLSLKAPATATADATLASVLLLSLYENITAIKSPQMLAWRSHIDGAVVIVKTRGRAQMCSSKTGAHLFKAVRHYLISRTLSSGLPIPCGPDWWLSRDGTEPESLLASSQRFALETGELSAQASCLLASTPHTTEGVELILEMATVVQDLDHQIAGWMAAIPSEYRFKTMCWATEDDVELTSSGGGGRYDEAEVFPGSVDVYTDFVTASAYNIARVSRLVLASLRIRFAAFMCAPADYRATAEYVASHRVCGPVIAGILASVPYHLGWRTRQGELFDNSPERSGFACGVPEPARALAGLFLYWPLTCVKNFDLTSDDQRTWVTARLKFIETQVGLKCAGVVRKAEFRFPSMMIGNQGSMVSPDPMRKWSPGLPRRNEKGELPQTPESLSSATQSPQPNDADAR